MLESSAGSEFEEFERTEAITAIIMIPIRPKRLNLMMFLLRGDGLSFWGFVGRVFAEI